MRRNRFFTAAFLAAAFLVVALALLSRRPAAPAALGTELDREWSWDELREAFGSQSEAEGTLQGGGRGVFLSCPRPGESNIVTAVPLPGGRWRVVAVYRIYTDRTNAPRPGPRAEVPAEVSG
jgi:hypothetical protein